MSQSKTPQQNQRGFTVVEILVVVAITGALAAIGIPAYSTYSARAKVAEGIHLLSTFKQKVQTYYIRNDGEWPTKYSEMGYPTSYDGDGIPLNNQHFSKLACHGSDCSQLIIRITSADALGLKSSVFASGGVRHAWPIALIAIVDEDTGAVSWKCSPGPKGTGRPRIGLQYLPSNCRELLPA